MTADPIPGDQVEIVACAGHAGPHNGRRGVLHERSRGHAVDGCKWHVDLGAEVCCAAEIRAVPAGAS